VISILHCTKVFVFICMQLSLPVGTVYIGDLFDFVRTSFLDFHEVFSVE
jgi:hypothetical protein